MDSTTGKPTTTERIQEIAASYEQEIIALRRHFHQHPETGGKEVATSQFICDKLDELGVEYRRVQGERPEETREGRDDFLGTGIIATIRGTAPDAYGKDGAPKRRIALRTDMDGLPVTEKTGADYASRNQGFMHACGHDCHMAMMLGAVKVLNDIADELHGEVRVIFQPAEEISLGARDMIAAGALEGVSAIYGTHIWSEVDAGKVSVEPGQRMANTDWFRIDVSGASAHGSMPHKGIDAIVVTAEIVTNLQVLVSRDVSPFEPAVVTVGEFHGGEARNIMAGSAYITGTVRTWSKKMRKTVHDTLERICSKTASAFLADIEFSYEAGNPGLSNDPEHTEVAREAAVKVLGEQALVHYEGTLAGEDFSEYLTHVPGVFVFLGARNSEIGAVHPQHSCFFTVDESVLVNGSMLAAQWAADELA